MITPLEYVTNLEDDGLWRLQDLLIVLGPTASGKTKLAVQLANHFDAEIISADSRQVYRGLDIGTGKDLNEYGNIPYHLIDILDAGEKYNITRFLNDFQEAYEAILARGKKVIVCGGTGFYIQSLLTPRPYAQVPIDLSYRDQFIDHSKEELVSIISNINIPKDFDVDFSSRKRIIRALEILEWLRNNSLEQLSNSKLYDAHIIGLNPSLEMRREKISNRLKERLSSGMIEEVESLLNNGVSYEELEYYGLEYKYISYFLQSKISFDEFYKKLETEIHRYAKRQMTYFRKMEKDGIEIRWF